MGGHEGLNGREPISELGGPTRLIVLPQGGHGIEKAFSVGDRETADLSLYISTHQSGGIDR